ncbi:MAG: two pore domain potassium channel family protein [Bacteroidales bacterium]|nr:two pore domain potassium channel family protein [Bacteroidales bacterium]MBD5302562.1 two pore domain potassium channel family protein [Bacteroides sp.]
MSNHTDFKGFFRAKGIFMILHILILLLSILLIVLISVDTFHNINFYDQPKFEKWQVWICCVFLADFFIEWILSKNKKHYLLTHFIFFLVSIPYQALIYRYGLDQYISKELSYIIRYMPLIRGGYALAIVVGWFTSNKATGLFFSYIIILLSTVYFSSLTFFLFEKGVNPLVKNYTDALWWAAMDVTTVGSNIVAVTGVGRVLSVLLAALGMMMFPIFTVYVTNLITKRNQEAVYSASFFNAFKNYEKNHPENNSNNASDASGDNKTPETANTSSDK